MSEKFRPKDKAEGIAYEKGYAASETNFLIYLHEIGEGAKIIGDTATWMTCRNLYDSIVAGDHLESKQSEPALVAAGEAN